MSLYDKVANSIENIQGLPEQKRHSIFLTIMSFSVLVMVIYGILYTKNSFQQIGSNLKSASVVDSTGSVQTESMNDNVVAIEDSSVGFEDWTSYYNVDYSYGIKYPYGWQIEKSNPAEIKLTQSSLVDGNVQHIKITVKQSEETISLDEEIKKVVANLQSDVFSMSKVNIGGEDGFSIKFICENNNCGPREYFVVKDNNLYVFYSSQVPDEIVEGFISTFTFI